MGEYINPAALKHYNNVAKHGTVQQILLTAKVSKFFRKHYLGAIRWARQETKKRKKKKFKPPSTKNL